MNRVKILGGFNSDLIGKLATVVNEQNDGMIEVIVDGRESMRYTIPASTVQKVGNLTPEPTVKEEVIDNNPKKCIERIIINTEQFLNELKEFYEVFKRE